MMLLELGSGERPFHDGRDWTHSDERSDLPDIELLLDAGDIFGDCTWLNVESVKPLHVPIAEECCDEIRACHLLEHFPYWDTVRILTDWKRVLKHDGTIHIEVPNLAWQARAILDIPCDPPGSTFKKDELVTLIFGEQNYEGNYHKTGFTPELLSEKLGKAGFIDINIQDVGQVLVADARRS